MNQENQIKAGDTVQLKSGSITMTVAWTDSDSTFCHYYNEGKSAFEKTEFPTITLKIAD